MSSSAFFRYDNQVKFTILASPLTWDGYSKTYESRFLTWPIVIPARFISTTPSISPSPS
ncbi:MAG: hypothetical protein U0401_08705 [Anaerolineae bacterium]